MNKEDSFINFKQLNLSDISKINLEEHLDIDADYLVLNAGVTKDNIFLRMSADEWSNVIDVNLNFYLLNISLKRWLKKVYRIVFISSVVAHTKPRSGKLYLIKSSNIRNGETLALELLAEIFL